MFVEYIYIYIYIYIWTVQPQNSTLKHSETETFHFNWKNKIPTEMELTTLRVKWNLSDQLQFYFLTYFIPNQDLRSFGSCVNPLRQINFYVCCKDVEKKWIYAGFYRVTGWSNWSNEIYQTNCVLFFPDPIKILNYPDLGSIH